MGWCVRLCTPPPVRAGGWSARAGPPISRLVSSQPSTGLGGGMCARDGCQGQLWESHSPPATWEMDSRQPTMLLRACLVNRCLGVRGDTSWFPKGLAAQLDDHTLPHSTRPHATPRPYIYTHTVHHVCTRHMHHACISTCIPHSPHT